MTNQKGFSLLEVLVSLLLITSTAVALLHQQWQLAQLFNQVLIKSQSLIRSDNHHERQSSLFH